MLRPNARPVSFSDSIAWGSIRLVAHRVHARARLTVGKRINKDLSVIIQPTSLLTRPDLALEYRVSIGSLSLLSMASIYEAARHANAFSFEIRFRSGSEWGTATVGRNQKVLKTAGRRPPGCGTLPVSRSLEKCSGLVLVGVDRCAVRLWQPREEWMNTKAG